MPTTGVSVAFAAFLAAALLGREFDRQSVAVVLLAAALPDFDTLAGFYQMRLHNALLHNLFIPAVLTAVLYYDLRVRDRSVLRARWGDRGVRIAWVSLVAFVLAGVGMDLLNIEGAAALWPLDGTYYSLVGKLEVNNKEGFVQTFVELNLSGNGPLVSVDTHPPQYAPALPYNPELDRYVLVIVESGWQLLFLLAAPVVLVARGWVRSPVTLADVLPRGPDAAGADSEPESAQEVERESVSERPPED